MHLMKCLSYELYGEQLRKAVCCLGCVIDNRDNHSLQQVVSF